MHSLTDEDKLVTGGGRADSQRDLAGRATIVVGASRGLGRGIATAATKNGTARVKRVRYPERQSR
jgi:hypothetical protein